LGRKIENAVGVRWRQIHGKAGFQGLFRLNALMEEGSEFKGAVGFKRLAEFRTLAG
jgi:hypothetical protein